MNSITCILASRRRLLQLTVATVMAAALAACGGGSGGDQRAESTAVASWSAALSDLNEDLSFIGITADTTPLSDTTVRQVVHVSAGGDRVRLKFSNLYGKSPLNLAKVGVAASAGAGAGSIVASSSIPVTFANGSATVSIAPGQETWSDPIAMQVAPAADIAVSIYVQTTTEVNTAHRFAAATRYEITGDAVTSATLPAAKANVQSSYWLREVDVYRSDKTNVLVTFGDSITDGTASTVDGNRRYPDDLSARFLQSTGVPAVSVVNMGLGGNRWLHDRFGEKGSQRFERDVLGVTGVTHALILLGVNDIGYQLSWTPDETVTANGLIAAMSAAVAAGKRAGVKVYFGTLTPFKGASYYSEEGEAIRQAMNNWIRTNTEAAGFVDFDKAVQDPADPLRYLAGNHSGDNLHPSNTGYQKMADAVDLQMFR